MCLADLGHPGLDPRRDGRRRLERVLEGIFQVPAQVLVVLRCDGEIERRTGT